MPQRHPLDPAVPWVDVVATEDDWDAAEPALLTSMYAQLVLVRTFEELVLTLAGEGLVHGPAHSSIGQEGGAVGSVLGLTSEDILNYFYRTQTYVRGQGGWKVPFVAENWRGQKPAFDVVNAATGEVVFPAGTKVSPRAANKAGKDGL